MSSNEASELRIAIARVLERWQGERMAQPTSERMNGVTLRILRAAANEPARSLARTDDPDQLWEIVGDLLDEIERTRVAVLSEHIEELKRAITLPATVARETDSP